MAAARAPAIKQLRKTNYASIEYAAHLFGACCIEQVMRLKYIEATKELNDVLERRIEALEVSAGTLDTEGPEDDVQNV